ncbi:MAG: trigger factor, partial [Nitrospinae bacterium]|nr:trigger factor [Nitrospinota bacterium]
VPGSRTENYGLVVGSKALIEGVENGLLDMRKGETRQIPVQFPETYENKTLAGHEVVFHVTMNEIKERVLPALDDEFAKEAGSVETLAELTEKVGQDLKAVAEREARRALHEVLVTRLIEANPFELPPGMVEEETQALFNDTQKQLRSRGIDPNLLQGTDEQRQQLRERAVSRIKRELLLEEIAKREGLTADDSEVEAELHNLAERTEQRVEYIRRQMEQAGALESIRRGILADKVLDFMAGRCTVTEIETVAQAAPPAQPEP